MPTAAGMPHKCESSHRESGEWGGTSMWLSLLKVRSGHERDGEGSLKRQ